MLTNGRELIEVHGTTVAGCLDDFRQHYPEAGRILFDRHGALVGLVALNGRVVPPEQMDQKVCDNDELQLIVTIAGG